MSRFLARRGLQTVATLLAATLLFFVAVYVIPGDPIRALFGVRRPPRELLEATRRALGYDLPLPQAYLRYLGALLHGNLGVSITGAPVGTVIKNALPVTLRLLAVTLGTQVVVGIGAGLFATQRRTGAARRVVRGTTLALLVVPVLVTANVVRHVFSYELQWFPYRGVLHGWRSYVLPAATLALTSAALVARMTEANLRATLDAPFVKAATARGLRRHRVIGFHALRPALPPVVTLVAADMSQFITALIIVEGIFGLPGLGGVVVRSIQRGDRSMVVGVLTFLTFVAIVASSLADVLQAALDPRVRLE